MPGLDTPIHVDMLKRHRRRHGLLMRILRAVRKEILSKGVYGLEWGDPDVFDPLKFIRDRYVLPYVNPEHDALEIGPGGGRWTRYLLGFRKLTVVEYHADLLEELRKTFRKRSVTFIRNAGTDFPGVAEHTIDYLFSFGTFVHLDLPLIEGYLANMKPILKPGANVVLHYSDMNKVMAQMNPGFSDNTPEKMRGMVRDAGFEIL